MKASQGIQIEGQVSAGLEAVRAERRTHGGSAGHRATQRGVLGRYGLMGRSS